MSYQNSICFETGIHCMMDGLILTLPGCFETSSA